MGKYFCLDDDGGDRGLDKANARDSRRALQIEIFRLDRALRRVFEELDGLDRFHPLLSRRLRAQYGAELEAARAAVARLQDELDRFDGLVR